MLHPALTENRLLFNIGHFEKNIFSQQWAQRQDLLAM
jgi:hypothetical protein